MAAYFGKQHFHVMRDIRMMNCSPEFTKSNFGFREEIQAHSTGSPKSTFAKEGILFIALGFTGDKASRVRDMRFIGS